LRLWRNDGRVVHRLSRVLGRARRHGAPFQGRLPYACVRGRRDLFRCRDRRQTSGVDLGCAARSGEAAPDQPERRNAGGLHSRGRTAVVAMVDETSSEAAQGLSIVSGPPLSDEPGLGSLTLPGFLREVTQEYGEREALVWRTTDGVARWTYAQLWERAIEVARALRGCGLGKDSRVGVLMTNRPEWLAAVFGTSLAGGGAVTLSTFSTLSELDYLITASAVSVLLFERRVLSKDFAAVVAELEPAIGTSRPGTLESAKYPFLRRLALVGEPAPGI